MIYPRILVVADDCDVTSSKLEQLQRQLMNAEYVPDEKAAVEACHDRSFQAIVVNNPVSSAACSLICLNLRNLSPEAALIILGSHHIFPSDRSLADAMLVYPASAEEIKNAIYSSIIRRQMRNCIRYSSGTVQ